MAHYTAYAALSWAETLYQMLHGHHFDGGPGQPGPSWPRERLRRVGGGIVEALGEHIRDAGKAETVKQLGRELSGRDPGEPPPLSEGPPYPYPPKKFDARDSVFGGLRAGALDGVLVAVAQRLAEAVKAGPVKASKPGKVPPTA